jgi:hypothetical protein
MSNGATAPDELRQQFGRMAADRHVTPPPFAQLADGEPHAISWCQRNAKTVAISL